MTVGLVVAYVLAGALAGLVTLTAVIRRRFLVLHVSGNSMSPLILDGDTVRARRVLPDQIRAGDVVAIRAPVSNLERVRGAALPPTPTPIVQWEEVTPPRTRSSEQIVIKRVVAAPGDKIPAIPGLAGAGSVLGAGRVIVLGDNAAESFDSRQFGPLGTDGVLGRVGIERLRVREDTRASSVTGPIGS
jgi:signal peptidase I